MEFFTWLFSIIETEMSGCSYIFGNSCFIHRECGLTKLELCFPWSNFSLSVKLTFAALWQGSAADIMINDLLMTLQTYLHAWMLCMCWTLRISFPCFPARPHDFFDAQTLDAIRHRAICFNLSAHIESLGKGHSVVFHSTVSISMMHSVCLPVWLKNLIFQKDFCFPLSAVSISSGISNSGYFILLICPLLLVNELLRSIGDSSSSSLMEWIATCPAWSTWGISGSNFVLQKKMSSTF